MVSLEPLRVTFDTNVCNFINDPNKPGSPAVAAAVRAAVADGRVKGFISEASLSLNASASRKSSLISPWPARPTPVLRPIPRTVAIEIERVASVASQAGGRL